MARGVGEIPWLLFCPFLKYLTRHMLQTSYVDENHHFLTYSAKNPAKISCFNDFLAKNWFLLIFMYIFNASKFPKARWLYEVTVTSYDVQWYSFWYQWIEEVHTYTLVANIGVSGVPFKKNPGGCNNPHSEDVLQKYIPKNIYKKYMLQKNTTAGRGLNFVLFHFVFYFLFFLFCRFMCNAMKHTKRSIFLVLSWPKKVLTYVYII